MRRLTAVFLFAVLFSGTCQKEEGLPTCLQEKMQKYEGKPPQFTPEGVWQYRYKGKTVYYVKEGCCDQYNKLYDKNCNLICQPDGGITGRGDGKCPGFFSERKNEKLVWEREYTEF